MSWRRWRTCPRRWYALPLLVDGSRHRHRLLVLHGQPARSRCGSPTRSGRSICCFLNKCYFDELYDFLFVRPAFRIAHLLWQTGDATLIDGVPNGLAELAVDGSKGAVRIQTGSIAVYAFVMLIGLVVLVGVFLIWR